jgi:arginine-tRNA-protein transferase
MNRPLASHQQHFYRTSALPCPYLDGRVERKLITELAGPGASAFYSELSRAGFRRSYRIAYRPACTRCAACRPVRIPVMEFVQGRSARRLRQVNADLTIRAIQPNATIEQYRLFARYQRIRHGDSDMAAMSYDDYRLMIEDSPLDTRLVTARDGEGRLVAACLIDGLDDGCSAVYSFFDPDQPRRSLGTWLVLQLIDGMRDAGLPYVYLGYWIDGSPKMRYKARFRPLEALTANGWCAIEGEPNTGM